MVTTPAAIVATLKRDGYTLEQGARYCLAIAHTARYGGQDCQEDANAYQAAAELLEAQAKAEKLTLDNVTRLEEENQHLAARVLELEKTIVDLIWGANI